MEVQPNGKLSYLPGTFAGNMAETPTGCVSPPGLSKTTANRCSSVSFTLFSTIRVREVITRMHWSPEMLECWKCLWNTVFLQKKKERRCKMTVCSHETYFLSAKGTKDCAQCLGMLFCFERKQPKIETKTDSSKVLYTTQVFTSHAH